MRLLRIVCLASFVCLAVPRLVHACTCVGWVDVEEMARKSPVVLVGRITATGDVRYAGPRWADFQVESVVKGQLSTRTVRVWDPWAESDCGGLLDLPAVGQMVVVTATAGSAVTSEARELWSSLGFAPPPAADLVIDDGACQQPLKVLTSTRDQRRWIRRRLP
jgi:hypothetical protein